MVPLGCDSRPRPPVSNARGAHALFKGPQITRRIPAHPPRTAAEYVRRDLGRGVFGNSSSSPLTQRDRDRERAARFVMVMAACALRSTKLRKVGRSSTTAASEL